MSKALWDYLRLLFCFCLLFAVCLGIVVGLAWAIYFAAPVLAAVFP